VIGRLALANGMEAQEVHTHSNDARGEFSAAWVLVCERREFFRVPEVASVAVPAAPAAQIWTDDYSSLLPLVRWRVGGAR